MARRLACLQATHAAAQMLWSCDNIPSLHGYTYRKFLRMTYTILILPQSMNVRFGHIGDA
jgi:hypothetical protein